jgi:signal transduction histidine kinase/FixJ family two-component response regulator
LRLRVGQTAILIGAVVLLVLIWVDTVSVIRADRGAALQHAGTLAQDRAVLFAGELDWQLAAIDQTLRILADEWRQNPAGFNMAEWQRRAVLLPPTSGIFRTDARGVIVQASMDRVIDRDISGTEPFRDATRDPPDAGHLHVGRAVPGPLVQTRQITLLRPLRDPENRFAGTIGIIGRTSFLTADFTVADLGTDSLVAVIGTEDGLVRATLGSAPGPDASIAMSGLFSAVRNRMSGIWSGVAGPNGTSRIYAFRRLRAQPLDLVVGIDRAQAFELAAKPVRTALRFAVGITVLVLLIAIVLLIELQMAVRRERRLTEEGAILAQANADLEAARHRADTNTAQLQAVLTNMADGVLMLDADLRVVVWNQKFAEIAGIPAGLPTADSTMEQLLRAQAAAGEFGDVDVETEVARRLAMLRSGELIGTIERRRPNGRVVELRRSRVPAGGFVTVITDITARKQAEDALRYARSAAEAATQAKARFAAMVGHEIHAPLLALLSSLDLLATDAGGLARPALFNAARSSGQALVALIDDILDLSRMEAGQLMLRPARFPLEPLLRQVIEMLRPQAEARGLTLRFSIADAAPAALTADQGRVRQVLVNFLSNAVKYTSAGEVVLRANRDRSSTGYLRLSVSDSGPAIPADQRVLLFEPFAQLEPRGRAGAGLGLAICRHLIALMGGEIGVRVTDSGGNEFWVTLPVLPEPPIGAGIEPRMVLPRTRILLVEDSAVSRLSTVLSLRQDGHMVIGVADGEATVRELARTQYDVLLLDLHLPGMGALDIVRCCRRLPGPNRMIPIVALTGDPGPDAWALKQDAGLHAVVEKGLSRAALRTLLISCVWSARPARQTAVPRAEEASPVLDETRLADLLGTLGPGATTALAEDCLRDLAGLTEELRLVHSANDRPATTEIIHAITGLAANYGLVALARRARATSAWEEVAAELARSGEALRAFVRDHARPPAHDLPPTVFAFRDERTG